MLPSGLLFLCRILWIPVTSVDTDDTDGICSCLWGNVRHNSGCTPTSAAPHAFSFTLLGYDAVMVTQTNATTQTGSLFLSPVPLTTIEVDFDATQEFRIIAKNRDAITANNTSESGILTGQLVIDPATDLPDLATFFVTDVNIYGGTLEVGVETPDPETTLAKDLPVWNDVAVTEIMWGHDVTPNSEADTGTTTISPINSGLKYTTTLPTREGHCVRYPACSCSLLIDMLNGIYLRMMVNLTMSLTE